MLPIYTPYLKKSYLKYIDYNWIGQGRLTERFERRIAEMKNRKYAVATNSCTTAILCGILSLGINKEKTILFPSYGFVAGANVIKFLGYKIELIDISTDNLSMSSWRLQDRLQRYSDDVGAVYFINHNGYSGEELMEIRQLCNNYHIPLIEDSACALDNPKGGITGDVSFFSFSVPKIITTGQGGMVLTDDKDIYINLLRWRDQGDENWRRTRDHRFIGLNFKFTDLQAGLGLAQLDNWKEIMRHKRQVREAYEYYFPTLLIPEIDDFHWYNLFQVSTPAVYSLLKRIEFPIEKLYQPIGHLTSFKYLLDDSNNLDNCFNADYVYQKIGYVPSGPGLRWKDIKKLYDYYCCKKHQVTWTWIE